MKFSPGWTWLIVSVVFETLADYFVKQLSIHRTWQYWVTTAVAYNLTVAAWMLSVRCLRQLTVPGMIWMLAGQAAMIGLGVGWFHEKLTPCQGAGVILSAVAMILLSL